MNLKEKAGGQSEWSFPALGRGWVDFVSVFGILNENGNNCPFSIEIEFLKEGPKDLGEINQAVADSRDFLTSRGFQL